jgi:hypothetical protein
VTLPKVTGLVWWKMGISHYKAVFRRARTEETTAGYTKDFLQAPVSIGQAFREMLGGQNPPYEPLAYLWPGGRFNEGKIYPAADYHHERGQGRLEVGQWTSQRAPHPWRIGDPSADPTITLPGDPEAQIPDAADAQWEKLEELEPWLMMVQLASSRRELHIRAYLGAPTIDLVQADLALVPESIRLHMTGQGGIVSDLPDVWFDPDDLRDPWRLSPETEGREATQATRTLIDLPPGTPPGLAYETANENPTSAAPEPFEVDPNERDRATRAHAVTQNALAEAVRARGREPLRPRGEPRFDLAWEEADGTFIVAEVKSITARNEERQLRLALGQVLRYCDLLEMRGLETRGLVVTSAQPSDSRWRTLCSRLGLGLMSPPDLPASLDAWLGTP